eukprot:768033-Hanusia_phi.AAC.1
MENPPARTRAFPTNNRNSVTAEAQVTRREDSGIWQPNCGGLGSSRRWPRARGPRPGSRLVPPRRTRLSPIPGVGSPGLTCQALRLTSKCPGCR